MRGSLRGTCGSLKDKAKSGVSDKMVKSSSYSSSLFPNLVNFKMSELQFSSHLKSWEMLF